MTLNNLPKSIRILFLFMLITGWTFMDHSLACAASVNETACYDPKIRTIRVHKEGFEMAQPVIQLGSDERLVISFDDLGVDLRRFRFTVIHCGTDWKTTTDLTPFEYLDGFSEDNIEDYQYSYNTTIRYTHYRAYFPNANIRPKLSGNYLLKVYDEDPSATIFTYRFMIVEPTPVVAAGLVVKASKIEDQNSRQQVDFTVRLNGFKVYDIGREIRVVIRQNGRWDNALMVAQPRFTRGEELDYRYDEQITFNGGNQFRYFDTKSLVYQSERIGKIAYTDSYQVFLMPDQPRTYKEYVTEKDLNGSYYIRNEEHAENSDIEADYTWVRFFLPFPAVLTSGSFYILGELTLWRLDESNAMTFNYELKGYQLNLLLKQGFYNYQYVLKEPTQPAADETLIEGNHWETENEYTILVYFRESGSLYDRLIAVNFLRSAVK